MAQFVTLNDSVFMNDLISNMPDLVIQQRPDPVVEYMYVRLHMSIHLVLTIRVKAQVQLRGETKTRIDTRGRRGRRCCAGSRRAALALQFSKAFADGVAQQAIFQRTPFPAEGVFGISNRICELNCKGRPQN